MPIYYLHFLGSGAQAWLDLVLYPGCPKMAVKVVAALWFSSGAQGAPRPFRCWKNSAPCGGTVEALGLEAAPLHRQSAARLFAFFPEASRRVHLGVLLSFEGSFHYIRSTQNISVDELKVHWSVMKSWCWYIPWQSQVLPTLKVSGFCRAYTIRSMHLGILPAIVMWSGANESSSEEGILHADAWLCFSHQIYVYCW